MYFARLSLGLAAIAGQIGAVYASAIPGDLIDLPSPLANRAIAIRTPKEVPPNGLSKRLIDGAPPVRPDTGKPPIDVTTEKPVSDGATSNPHLTEPDSPSGVKGLIKAQEPPPVKAEQVQTPTKAEKEDDAENKYAEDGTCKLAKRAGGLEDYPPISYRRMDKFLRAVEDDLKLRARLGAFSPIVLETFRVYSRAKLARDPDSKFHKMVVRFATGTTEEEKVIFKSAMERVAGSETESGKSPMVLMFLGDQEKIQFLDARVGKQAYPDSGRTGGLLTVRHRSYLYQLAELMKDMWEQYTLQRPGTVPKNSKRDAAAFLDELTKDQGERLSLEDIRAAFRLQKVSQADMDDILYRIPKIIHNFKDWQPNRGFGQAILAGAKDLTRDVEEDNCD